MSIEIDPEGSEIQTLRELVEFEGKNVLEVGCDDGRLTWRYADHAAYVIGIAPDEAAIAQARKHRPSQLDDRVDFDVSTVENFVPQHGTHHYDILIFSWSLACIDPQNMSSVLKKASRMLKPSGTLVNIQEVPHTRALEVHVGDRVTHIGALRDRVNFEDIKLAQSALSNAIDEGLFTVVDERVFDGYIYGESLDALQAAFPGTIVEDHQARHVASVIAQSETESRLAYQGSVEIIALTPGASHG